MAEGVTFSKGLAGVIADESRVCFIDGEAGLLSYRGYDIYEVAKNDATFDEVAYLLLEGRLPTREELSAFSQALVAARNVPKTILDMIKLSPREAHPMVVLQTTTAALGMFDEVQGEDRAANIKRAISLTAKFPTLIAAFARHKQGQEFVAPRNDLDHAANFLYMVNGEAPSQKAARTFEMALILHMEHSFNASTFTTRVVGGTLAPMYAAVSAGVGALYGPLHGGANERTLQMVDEIGSVDAAEGYVLDKLANKGKIMGMGHRVYKAKDPRSVILEGMLTELLNEKGDTRDLEILKRIETVMRAEMEKKGKDVWPNVDFFSGALYRSLGIATEHFTPIFALARIVGWAAHLLELWEDNRLYRPKAYYVGDKGLTWTPIEERR